MAPKIIPCVSRQPTHGQLAQDLNKTKIMRVKKKLRIYLSKMLLFFYYLIRAKNLRKIV